MGEPALAVEPASVGDSPEAQLAWLDGEIKTSEAKDEAAASTSPIRGPDGKFLAKGATTVPDETKVKDQAEATINADAKAKSEAEAKTEVEAKAKLEADKAGAKPAEGSKFAKEKARAQTQWDKIAEAKTELEKGQKELKAQQIALEALRSETTRREQELRAPREPTAAEYESHARSCDEQAKALDAKGEFELADEKRHIAKLAREAAAKVSTVAAPQSREPDMRAAHLVALQKAKAEFADLQKPDSALTNATLDFISANPEILKYGEGPYLAAKFCAAQAAAARVPVLEQEKTKLSEENETLKTKVAELEKAVAISPGGVTAGGAGERDWTDLTLPEQEAWLKSHAES